MHIMIAQLKGISPTQEHSPISFAEWAVVHAILYAFSAVFVFLRLLDRQRRRVFRATDILTICAFTLWTVEIAIALSVGNLLYGQGEGLTAATATLSMTVTTLHYTVTLLARLSVAFLLLELDPPRVHKRLIQAYIVLFSIYMVVNSTLSIFTCREFGDYQWSVFHANSTPELSTDFGEHRCTSEAKTTILHVVGSILAELLLFGLALPNVFRLRADRSTKLSLTFFFMLGFLNIVTTSMEVSSDMRALAVSDTSVESADHAVHERIQEAYWAVADGALSITIASILPLRALLVRFFRGLLYTMGFSTDVTSTRGDSSETEKSTNSASMPGQSNAKEDDIIIENYAVYDSEAQKRDRPHNTYTSLDRLHSRRSADAEELVATEDQQGFHSKGLF